MTFRGFDAPGVGRARGRGFFVGGAGPDRLVHPTGRLARDAEERIVGPGDVAAPAHPDFLVAVVPAGRYRDPA